MKVRVKLDQKAVDRIKTKLQALKAPMDKGTASDLGKLMVTEMRSMITKGISTIEGQGRFPAYKHQGVKNKYPASVKKNYPGKRDRPVNLTLSGDFLKGLDSEPISTRSGFATDIGYFDESEALKEQGHREGVHSQPKRPTIPKRGETFAQRIQRIISNIYRKRVRELSNK